MFLLLYFNKWNIKQFIDNSVTFFFNICFSCFFTLVLLYRTVISNSGGNRWFYDDSSFGLDLTLSRAGLCLISLLAWLLYREIGIQ